MLDIEELARINLAGDLYGHITPRVVGELIAEVRRLNNAEALILSYVAALLSNNVERAGDATRRMTDYALDHASKEPK
ncbi:MAG TPA: hypothetical protein VF534_27235 [Paraburkholderia sp.]